jgi:hypothetical protein
MMPRYFVPMRTFLYILALLLTPALCAAQSVEYWELYGGYEATRADISEVQKALPPGIAAGNGLWMNGGSVAVAEYKGPWFAGVIDLTAAKGSKAIRYPTDSTTPLFSASADPALYTLTGGPQFRIPYHTRTQPIGRVLLGAARVNLSLDPGLEDAFKTATPPIRSTQSSFAIQTGGGLDYRLTPHFALRATAEYLGTWFYKHQQSNLLISSGATFRFGF